MNINTKNTKWNLKPLLNSDHDPQIEKKNKIVEEKSYKFINKWKDREDYLKDPKILKEALDEYELWMSSFADGGDVGYYFWLRNDQDENNPKLKSAFNKVEDLSNKIKNDIQFFVLKIAKISATEQPKFLKNKELTGYKHFLERIFAEGEYLLSDAEEKVLNLKSKTSHSNWVKMTSGFLSREKGFSELLSQMESQKKSARDAAAKKFNFILEKNVDVAEQEINSILANKKNDDELRGFKRPDASRHFSDDIESEVVDALIEAVTRRFDISQKYYKLKAQLLSLKKLKYHERNIAYGKINKSFSFADSAKLVHQVFQQLDKKFADIFSKFLNNSQIDIYPRQNKRDGAFCAYFLKSQPVYIKLNHTDRFRDVLTLAHELGHGINDELVKEKQNALNFGTPLSTAEVASTFMEDFVLQEILREADEETRLAIMMQKLNDDISTIFRQVACYKFEQDLHREFREKGYLSKKEIGNLFQKNMSAYMGSAVEQSSGSENWWVYWSHIRNFFYVYSYASGLLISKSLQASVKNNPEFISQVKEFLSTGLSDSPKNIFHKLGINIADKKFWERGLDEVEKLLEEVEKLAAS